MPERVSAVMVTGGLPTAAPNASATVKKGGLCVAFRLK